MKFPGGDTLTRYLKHMRDYIKHGDDNNSLHSQRHTNMMETTYDDKEVSQRYANIVAAAPTHDPWVATYRRCMTVGTKATDCVIPRTAFKILREVAPEAIEKFIAARNIQFPCSPPDDRKKRYQKDRRDGTTPKTTADTKDKVIPKQYKVDNQKTLNTNREEHEGATSDHKHSDDTYGKGKMSDEDDKQQTINEMMHMIRKVSRYDQNWDEKNIMNAVTVRAHLEYKERFAGTVGSERASYIISDSGANTYVIAGPCWIILDTDPIRKANLVAFDANKM